MDLHGSIYIPTLIHFPYHHCAKQLIKSILRQGAWVAQLVEHLTFGFGSDHDLRVVGLSPTSGSVLRAQPA